MVKPRDSINRGLRGCTTQGGHEILGSGVTPGLPWDPWKKLGNVGKHWKNMENSGNFENPRKWAPGGPLDSPRTFGTFWKKLRKFENFGKSELVPPP